MKLITFAFILNSTLLILHEIESAYEKEWEILHLPGNISGFLLLHIPIILVMFYGLVELEKLTKMGLILSIILGIGGILPFLVHNIFVKRDGRFNRPLSNVIICLNSIAGGILVYLSIGSFV